MNIRGFAVLALSAFCGVATAQRSAPPSPSVFMGYRVQITQPKIDPQENVALGPATICLTSSVQQQCYTAPKHDPAYGLRPKAIIVQLTPSAEALLFTAVASGGGSGERNHIALLQPGKGRQLRNLMSPDLSMSEQGEYQFLNEPSISKMPLFIVADYVWSDGESHFSRHRFRISTYVFGPTLPNYGLRDEYVTSKKYASYDDAEKITVIQYENAEILARLKRQQ